MKEEEYITLRLRIASDFSSEFRLTKRAARPCWRGAGGGVDGAVAPSPFAKLSILSSA